MKKIIIAALILLIIIAVFSASYLFLKQNNPQNENSQNNIICAKEGELFSPVYKDKYPAQCCSGLTEWNSGIDARISIEGICYNTEMDSGYPVGTCINCGNNICDERENVCNCPEDCKGGEHSSYPTAEDFCKEYVGANTGITSICKENNSLPLCKLCEWQ